MSEPEKIPPQESGRRGGKAGRGKSKARTSEQARAAILERWRKWKAKKDAQAKQNHL